MSINNAPNQPYTPPGTIQVPGQDNTAIGGSEHLGPDAVTPADPNLARLSQNGSFAYNYNGANHIYRLRVIAFTHEVHPVFEQGEARHRRAFYPHAATVGPFSVVVALNGYREKERLMRWLAAYVETVLGSETLQGGKGFPMMDVMVPGMKFHRKGIPLQGMVFGDHVGALVWQQEIFFGPAEDPFDVNVVNTFPSEFVGQNAFDVDKEKNSSYFYPQAPHIVNWSAPDEYEKLTDIGKLEDILSQRLPLPPHIQNTGWPTSAGPFGTGGKIIAAGGGGGGGGTTPSTAITPGGPPGPAGHGWMPGAIQVPVNISMPGRTGNRAAVLHTNGGGPINSLKSEIIAKGGIGGHFQVRSDGTFEQYMPIEKQMYHAFAANAFAVGIETMDHSTNPSNEPWTAAQVAAIVRILRWIGCPRKIFTSPSPQDGVGWHRQFPEFNRSGHICPGNARIAQVPGIVNQL